MSTNKMVIKSLRRWFILHFFIDYIVALPLFFIPIWTLHMLRWTIIDPFATRLVAAALFGIGGISFLARNETQEVYIMILNLKIIWSCLAIAGILSTMLQGGPVFGWVILTIFSGFCIVWIIYRKALNEESL
ncbi:hypothetical protein HZB00_00330 [Candidatus Woesearchaeota archaeon]|nr:hypothetical protein [Candidatus Woesearchaeota archaeon]